MALCVSPSCPLRRPGLRGWILSGLIVTMGVSFPDAQDVVRKRIAVPAARLRLARELKPAEAEAADATAAIPEAPVASDRPLFHLRDSGRIAGDPVMETLRVETAYGLLAIPKDQIVRVRFARRLAPELEARIETLIGQLGSEDFDTREAATVSLQEIGAPAARFLRKAVRSDSEEVQNRAKSILAEIPAETGGGRGDGSESSLPPVSGSDDEVVTARMTIRGKVLADDFRVQTRYGELRVALGDLAGITFQSLLPSETKVDVTAQHQAPGNWADTRIDLLKGQRFKIAASGNINVSNYGIVAGPTGNTDWSGHATFGNFPMLSLVGRVGKRGEPFLVGSAYTGKSKSEGRLYLAVVPFSPYPQGAQGTYQAKVHALGSD